MSSKSTRKKRTSNKKKIGEDCVKDNECFTNYCYNNKCTSKTRSYEIIEKLNKQLKEHYNDLRIMKQEKENLEELLDNDNNTIEENIKFIDEFERINKIIKEINIQIKNVQEQLKDDSSSKKSLNILSSRRDARKKKTYECLFCLGEIDDINDSFRCPANCDNGYFHLDCVKRFCESTKTLETYNYNPGTNDTFSHQEYRIKAKCPSCFTDWTRICDGIISSSTPHSPPHSPPHSSRPSSPPPIQQNNSRNPSVQSDSSYESIFGMDPLDDDDYYSDDNSVDELANILGNTTIDEGEIDMWRRHSDSPPWSNIPLDDPRNQMFHDTTISPPSYPSVSDTTQPESSILARQEAYSSRYSPLPPVTPPPLQEEAGPYDNNPDYVYLQNYSIRLIVGLEKVLQYVLDSPNPHDLNYDHLMKNVQIRSSNKYDLFKLHDNIHDMLTDVPFLFSLNEYQHIYGIYESNLRRLFNDKHPGFATRLGRGNPVVDMWWKLLELKKIIHDNTNTIQKLIDEHRESGEHSQADILQFGINHISGGKRKTKKRNIRKISKKRKKILSGSKKKRGKR
jgi:hypothetical protein